MSSAAPRSHPLPSALLGLLLGCAPPALPELGSDQGPSIGIVFPQSRSDITICPNFVVSVDIDGIEMVDFHDHADNVSGEGHWHLYIGDTYQNAFSDPWAEASVPEGVTGPVIIRARLAENDHTESDIEAAAEIVVGETDCVGGGNPAPPGDTAY